MNFSKPMLQNPSSSRLGQATQADQDSMRFVLKSCLDHLNMLEYHMQEQIQEIRTLIVNLLDNCQSDVTMADSGGYDSTVISHAGLDGLNATPPFISSHDRPFMPRPVVARGVTGLLPGSTGPHGPRSPTHFRYGNLHATGSSLEPPLSQFSQDSSLHGASNSVYEPSVHLSRGARFEEHGRPAARSSFIQPPSQYNEYSEAILPCRYGDSHFTESSLGPPLGLGQFSQDSSLRGTSNSVYEPTAQPSQNTHFASWS